MRARRRCAQPQCRHAPRAHGRDGAAGSGCSLCTCTAWTDHRTHVWREDVTEAWLLATESWLVARERVAVGYETEQDDFERNHPRPRLADFMRAMSPGVPPEELAELMKPPVCTSCCGTGHEPQEAA